MSRDIDLSKPLSDFDRQYLIDRNRWAALAEADGHGDPAQAMRDASARREGQPSPGPAPQPPTIVAGDVPVTEGAAAVQGDEDKPYEEWAYQELQEELKLRKQLALDEGMDQAQADELYKAGGKQAELVQRLKDDDERAEAQQ